MAVNASFTIVLLPWRPRRPNSPRIADGPRPPDGLRPFGRPSVALSDARYSVPIGRPARRPSVLPSASFALAGGGVSGGQSGTFDGGGALCFGTSNFMLIGSDIVMASGPVPRAAAGRSGRRVRENC